MRKILLLCLLSGIFTFSYAATKVVEKPYVEGKGMKGWLIDSIKITNKQTLVYGHFGLGKGSTAWGSLDNYIEIPSTGKLYKQTDQQGELPLSPKKIIGTGQQVSFIMVFKAIPANTKVINITSDDFDGKGAAWYGVWLTPRTTIFTEKLSHLPSLEGNWYSVDGKGDWKAGIYEKKIFWNNRFWNYNLVKTTPTSATFELWDRQIRGITLDVTQQADDEMQFSDNINNFIFRKQPVYTKEDNTTFRTGFAKNDSITVSGFYQVANPVFSKQAALLVDNLFSEQPDVYPVKIDNEGLFTAKIPFEHTSKVTFSNQLGPRSPLSEVSFMAEPGDKIILTYRNENEKGVVYGGENQRFNNEFNAFAIANPYFVNRRKAEDKFEKDLDKFTEWRNGEYAKLKTGFFDWQLQNAANAKLQNVVFNAAKYGYVTDMLVASFASKNEENISKMLPPVTNTAYYNNEKALYSDDYRYMLKTINSIYKSGKNANIGDICKYFLKNAEISDEEKSILENMIDIDKSISTKEGFEKYKVFMTDNREKINNLFKKNQDLIKKQSEEKMAEAQQKYALPKGLATDYVVATEMADFLSKGERTITEEEQKKFTEKCNNKDFADLILLKNSKVEKSLQVIKEGKLPDNIKVHEIPATESNLTNAIVDKFKGKVIYLDFWATWCGPCKSEMPHSKKQKEDLKGKNVVFVYLTGNSSPELTWKKMIADIPGDHIRLTEEQWNAICKQYNVTGIPRYMLFDKKGEIANQNAPRPSSGDELKLAIKELLK
ncbi:MAG TPA: TlpA disulfide reductase family protein [Paludibacter sp.]|nr:TlpA disulfide reductase family protein [Paludibacter sp.]